MVRFLRWLADEELRRVNRKLGDDLRVYKAMVVGRDQRIENLESANAAIRSECNLWKLKAWGVGGEPQGRSGGGQE